MSDKVTNIAKNTSYFTIALIMQKVISFTYFIILARSLGPEDLGKYYFAISFTTIFAIIIDLGFANVLTREVAKDNSRANSLLGAVLALKLPLTAITALIVALLINILGYPEITRDLVYLSMFCMVLDSFTLTFFSISRGFHNLSYESISSVIFQLIVFLSGGAIIILKLGLRWLLIALVLASLYNFFYALYVLRKKWKLKIRPDWNYESIKMILRISAPFTLMAIFSRVYSYSDSVLLSTLDGDRAVGIYQVAFKIIFALQFLPMAFVASLYPALSLYWTTNKEQLSITFERAMNYLVIISLPISAGAVILADKIILLFKSGYSDAIVPLQITMSSLIFLFLSYPVGSLLNACDRQKANTYNLGITVLASIVLNLMLIPKFGAAGASVTVLLTNILMFTLGFLQAVKIIKYRYAKNFKVFSKVFFSSLIMAAAAYLLKEKLNVFIVIAIGGMIYFSLLVLLGGVKKDDVLSILASFKKNKVKTV